MAACSGGGHADRGEPAPTSTIAEPATSAPPATIDLSHPIPGGSLHGAPRPPLENTGDDYVAITKSLIANFRWLTENPDLGVISEVWMPGTADHDARIAAYQFLIDENYRWADEGYQVLGIELVNSMDRYVAIRVKDRVEYERLVDSNGAQVGSIRTRSPEVADSIVLLSSDQEGRWRIADWASGESLVVEP